jgi:hypothetical protein
MEITSLRGDYIGGIMRLKIYFAFAILDYKMQIISDTIMGDLKYEALAR